MSAPTLTSDEKLNDAIPSDYSEDCAKAYDRLNEKHLEPISEWASSSSIIIKLSLMMTARTHYFIRLQEQILSMLMLSLAKLTI